MALQNIATGEYLKITAMQFDFKQSNHHISYYIFANKEQRDRFDSGLTPYEVYVSGMYNGIGNIENALIDVTDKANTKDALFDAMYKALKSDMFSNWTDC